MTEVEEMQDQKDQGPHLVLIPLPFQGHLNPMLQLATILHSKGFLITIVHTQFNSPNPSNHPNFNFEPIPDGLSDDRAAAMDLITLVAALNVACKAPSEDLLRRLVLENPYGPVKCIISDAMMHFTQDVASILNIPRVVIRTSSAISFAAFTAFPLLKQEGCLAVQGVEGMQAQKDKGPHLVLFPIPFQGHINPMLQLATLLHSKGFSITIIHTNFNAPNPSNYPSFNFEPIPDGLSDDRVAAMDLIALVAALNVACKAPFEELLGRLVLENPYGPIKCIISDAMMHFTQEVAALLDIPRIVIRTSSAISFAAFAAFPLLRQKGYLAVKDHQSKAPVPELPPLRCKDLPSNGFATSDPNTLYHLVTHMVDGTRTASGVIWNAFDYLERLALMKIVQDFQIPNFSVGPLHKHASSSSSSLLPQDHGCIAWLDKQVHGSVLYVSFGSLAAMDKSELVETAWGLADSNQHFLWVVRPGSVHGSDWVELPKGFEEKTEGRCLVVKWAPQQEVLAHPAVGGFWTHGGWNSTLESICEGVPMICSPWFSDQRVNARYVDHVWRVGMQLDNGFERGEIEQAIRRLMVGNDGQEMRTRIKVLKENADGCLREGGSSYESLNSLKDYILSL